MSGDAPLLPFDTYIRIFWFLDPRDLCACAQVCRLWHQFAGHNLIWRPLLRAHSAEWEIVTNESQPQHHRAFWSAKATYMKGLDKAAKLQQEQKSPPRFRIPLFPFRRRPLRIAFFGQGLEGCAWSLVGRIIEGSSFPFQVNRMYPGVDGVGSGIGGVLSNHLPLNLIFLYQKSAKERRLARGLSSSRLVRPDLGLSDAAKTLCGTIDAFVLVTDSSKMLACEAEQEDYRLEMGELLDARWTRRSVPMLVLACRESRAAAAPALSPVGTADVLQLGGQTRRWRVVRTDMDDFARPVVDGLEWLCAEASA